MLSFVLFPPHKVDCGGMGLFGKLKLGRSPSLPHPHNPLPPGQDEALLNPTVVQDPESPVLVNITFIVAALVYAASASVMVM